MADVPALTIGSLFSGIGGLELGVTRALTRVGIRSRIAWQAEQNPYARAVLKKHWPEVRRYEDVRHVDASAPPVDLELGGFPCQDLSIAGARAGIHGARSGLWFEFVRIIRDTRPKYVFVENVPELLVYLGDVLGPLADLGFDAEWDLFDAAAVGAPHLRERLFLLAYLPDAPHLGREVGQQGGAREKHAATSRHRRPRPVADPDGLRELQQAVSGQGHGEDGTLADADGGRLARRQQGEGRAVAGRGRRPQARTELARPAPWPPEPDVGRVVDGVRTRLDGSRRRERLVGLGGAVVPAQGELAFLTLAARAGLLSERPGPHG